MLTSLDPDSTFGFFALSRMVVGLGLPFMFIPITVASYDRIVAVKTDQASALINSARNFGGPIRVSLSQTVLAQREQFHQARLSERIGNRNPLNPASRAPSARRSCSTRSERTPRRCWRRPRRKRRRGPQSQPYRIARDNGGADYPAHRRAGSTRHAGAMHDDSGAARRLGDCKSHGDGTGGHSAGPAGGHLHRCLRPQFSGSHRQYPGGQRTVFSLLPAENATGNYVKVVQRIPVKITFDRKPGVLLGPGMPVVPTVTVR
jgi:hypothetical protein